MNRSAFQAVTCLLLAAIAWQYPCVAEAQSSTTEERSVEAGREALDGGITFPWYDAEADQVKRVDVAPPAELKNRRSRWAAKVSAAQGTWSMPPWLAIALEILGWTLLLLALLTVGYLLVRTFLSVESRTASSSESGGEAQHVGHSDRVESLPFQLQQPRSDLLSEARRHYEAGNYGEAIVYLYSHLLVELDRHQWIRLTKGKTNRQYLREVRRRGEVFSLLQRTMFAFEDVFFGNLPLGKDQFEACWNELETFHRSLEQAAV